VRFAAEAGVLQALEEGKSEEEALQISQSGAIASPLREAQQHERYVFSAVYDVSKYLCSS